VFFYVFFVLFLGIFCTHACHFFFEWVCILPFFIFLGFFLVVPAEFGIFVVMCGIFRNGSFKYTMCFFICFFLRSLTALSVFNSLLSIWCFGKCQSGTIYSFVVVIFTCHRTLCHMLRFVALRTGGKHSLCTVFFKTKMAFVCMCLCAFMYVFAFVLKKACSGLVF